MWLPANCLLLHTIQAVCDSLAPSLPAALVVEKLAHVRVYEANPAVSRLCWVKQQNAMGPPARSLQTQVKHRTSSVIGLIALAVNRLHATRVHASCMMQL